MTRFLTYIFIFLFTFTSSVNAGYFVKSESGLTVAGSLYSIQDSARKIYSWVDGKGYEGNTTYVDPISGEVYTSDAMLKDGAVDLATAAAISGAFKIGGKVVGKTGKSVKDTVNSIDDITRNLQKSKIQNSPKKVANYEKMGGISQLERDFNKLNTGMIEHKGNGVVLGIDKYGNRINMHNSRKNGATLEIIDKNTNFRTKIRYK